MLRVLLTNDDGIGAKGLQTLRRALLAVEGVELAVIAPDANRSATARSITFRAADVGHGGRLRGRHARLRVRRHAGRLRAPGDAGPDRRLPARPDRVRHQPRLQPRRRHHLLGHRRRRAGGRRARHPGDRGLAAVAAREMDFRLGERFDFTARRRSWRAWSSGSTTCRCPTGTLLNINVPAGDPRASRSRGWASASTATRWSVVEEEDGRRRFRIYGDAPDHDDEQGTDLAAVSAGRDRGHAAALRPHRRARAGGLRAYDLAALLQPAAEEVAE